MKYFRFLVISLFIAAAAVTQAQAAPFAGDAIGKIDVVRTQGKETLSDMAVHYQIGYAQLLAANPGVDPWLPGSGRDIVLPNWHLLPNTVHEGLVLNIGELRLYYYPKDGSAPTSFPIGIGREGLTTPQGTTTIIRKVDGPSWSPTPRMRQENPELPATVPPGPDNPLGVRAMYLGWPSYRIHGTDKEKAVGRRASSGCIRMYKDEIIWLYDHTPIGTKVTSVNEPVKIGWIDNELYLEASPNDLQIDELEYKNRQVSVDMPDGIMAKIRQKAGDQISRINWEQVRSVLVNRTGIPVKITGNAMASTAPVMKQVAERQEMAHQEAKPARTAKLAEQASGPARKGVKELPHDWDNLNSH